MTSKLLIMPVLSLLLLSSGALCAQSPPPLLSDHSWDIWNPTVPVDTGFDFDADPIGAPGTEGQYYWTASGIAGGQYFVEWGIAWEVSPGVYEVFNMTKGLSSGLEWNGSVYVKTGGDGLNPRELRAQTMPPD